MLNKTLLLLSFLLTSHSVSAEQSLFEGAAATGQALKNVQKAQESVQNAPEALKGQAQDTITESAPNKLQSEVPEQTVDPAKNSAEPIKKTAEPVNTAPAATIEESKPGMSESNKKTHKKRSNH